MKFSIIIPVFNRPDEVDELLKSLCQQSVKDFEVLIIEDGSSKPCKDVCDKYADILALRYFAKENSGPGQSRNYGAERAQGEYVIILDSDVVLPAGYLKAIDEELQTHPTEAFGGPDASHPTFTPIQKAISYSMTSFFTTGGIRGGKPASHSSKSPKKALDKFFPRSFNMGIRKDVYQQLGGFSQMRFGEDIDFSYRIVEAGYQPRLFPKAWVWHKRRTDFKKFFRQVYHSGMARINLEKRHPGTLKLVHLLPTVFTVGVIALIILSAIGRALMHYDDADRWYWFCFAPWLPILLYSMMIFVDSSYLNRSMRVGLLSIPAAFTQLMGYGFGFLEAWWKRCVRGQDEQSLCNQSKDERAAFEQKFYQ